MIACGISNPSGRILSARNTHYALLILTSSVSSISSICTLSVVPASQNTGAPFSDISVTEDKKMDAQIWREWEVVQMCDISQKLRFPVYLGGPLQGDFTSVN